MAESTSKHARWGVGAFAALAAFGAIACDPIPPDPAVLGNGVFCLSGDVDAVGVVSVFQLGSNTTLDCQGHRIRDASGATSFAVYVYGGDNVVVKNCIFEGFSTQVRLLGTTNYRLEDNQFLYARGWTIQSTGDEGLITRNTFRSGPQQGQWTAGYVDGIADIIGNTIIMGNAPSLGASDLREGFLVNGKGVVAHNLVQAIASPGGAGLGIASGLSTAYRNVLVSTPGSYRVGLACYDGGGFRFKNFIVGSYPYSNIDCRTNLPEG
jgi:hypothetical protein